MVNFGSGITLVRNFILMAYADIFNKRVYDLIGVGEDSKSLKGYHYSIERGVYEEAFSYNHNNEIHLVIPADYSGIGTTSYVIVTKKTNSRYLCSIYFKDEDTIRDLGETTAVPLLYACPRSLKPVLLVQRSSGMFEEIEVNDHQEIDMKAIGKHYGKLSLNHTSAFVDINGTMKASLCLMVEEGKRNLLRVLANGRDGFAKSFEMELPHGEIGPVVFEDFNASGMNDMAFVYKSGSSYFLRIYPNMNSRNDGKEKRAFRELILQNPMMEVFSESKYTDIDLGRMFPTLTPVLRSVENDSDAIPCGIFTADLRAKGIPNIFLTMRDQSGISRVIVLENMSTPSKLLFELAEYSGKLSELENVISVSCCDYNNMGRETVFLNRIVDGRPVLEAYENNLSKENLKITLSAILPSVPRRSYGSGIPGVSYLISYGNDMPVITSNQMTYSTFVHLKHGSAYIGLGTTGLVMRYLVIGVPGHHQYSDPYVISSIVIPNTDLIVYIRKSGGYSVETHFIIGEHFKTVVMVLCTVAAVNLVFTLLLHYRDRRKAKMAKSADKLHPLFSTLR